VAEAICSIPDCGRPVFGRGWCNSHYKRWYRYGDPLQGGPPRTQLAVGALCEVPDCDEPAAKRCWCSTHYRRWQRHGDVQADRPIGALPVYAPTYNSAHARLRRMRGNAAEHLCVDCAGPAEQWSYDHGCPDERIDNKTGYPWCVHLECYSPRDRSCHGLFDARRNRSA